MKHYRWLPGVVAIACLAVSAHADQTYICTYGQKERVITVVYDDQASKLPCEVRYTKDGATDVMWHASTETGYCDQKAQAFIQQHLDWGWRCSGGKQSSLPVIVSPGMPSKEEVSHYRLNAYMAQAISVAAPFRLEVMSYRMEYGRYPKSLDELGYQRKDMRNSSHIGDLRIGDEGTILILGNQNIGVDTVIALKPSVTLGGTSIEWQCSTNIETDKIINCAHDSSLRF